MRSILFQVTPTDPLTVAGTLTALALVALAATIGPAMRAARLDPVAALRDKTRQLPCSDSRTQLALSP